MLPRLRGRRLLRRRNAVRIADLSEVNLALVAVLAGVMPEVLDREPGFRKHRKQDVPIVAHDVQRHRVFVVHIPGRIDRLGRNDGLLGEKPKTGPQTGTERCLWQRIISLNSSGFSLVHL